MSTMAQRPAVFTPEAVASINRAYEKALVAVAGSTGGQDLRVKLAEHLMAAARTGEKDEHLLCRRALDAVLGTASRPSSSTAPQALEG